MELGFSDVSVSEIDQVELVTRDRSSVVFRTNCCNAGINFETSLHVTQPSGGIGSYHRGLNETSSMMLRNARL